MSNKILIASDHAGFALKEQLEAQLTSLGYRVEDLGPSDETSVATLRDILHRCMEPCPENRALRMPDILSARHH